MTVLQTSAVMVQHVWMVLTLIVAVVLLGEKESTAVLVSRDAQASQMIHCI